MVVTFGYGFTGGPLAVGTVGTAGLELLGDRFAALGANAMSYISRPIAL